MRNFLARCKNLLLASSPDVSTHPARAGIPQVITVHAFRHYGAVVYYPTCPKGRQFAAIAGTKTLTLRTISHIQDLGYLVYSEPERDPIHGRFL